MLLQNFRDSGFTFAKEEKPGMEERNNKKKIKKSKPKRGWIKKEWTGGMTASYPYRTINSFTLSSSVKYFPAEESD